MPAAYRSSPQIIGGNGHASLFHFQADDSVGVGGFLVDVQHLHCGDPFAEPIPVNCPVA
jgi:hypothetical protein